MKIIRCLHFAALGAIISACSSDSSVAPNRQPASLDQAWREMTLPLLTGAGSLSGIPAPSIAATLPSSCSYSASTQSFACPSVTVSGLTITRSYTLLDASGRSQPAFDAATTASVRAKTTTVGTINSEGTSLTIDQTQELTLSGLLTGTHTLDGTSTAQVTGTVKSGLITSTVASAVTTSIVKLVVSSAAAGATAYPASGTITVDVVTTTDNALSTTVHFQMTFNGTSKVSVVISSALATTHCTLDLANPSAFCA